MPEKANVTARIMRYIKKNIKEGIWPVGSKIASEHQICEALGVSRTSVRSALQQFIALDILKSYHGKGTYVLTDDLSAFGGKELEPAYMADVTQLLEFRHMIEPQIAAKVAPGATPLLIRQLEDILAHMKNHVGDTDAYVQYDIQFHQEICNATDNPVVMRVMENIYRQKIERYYLLNYDPGYYSGLYAHALLVDSFKKHDAALAQHTMEDHLFKCIEELRALRDGASSQLVR
nr:FCD domain-containing protein [Maliibacterium massiliense]